MPAHPNILFILADQHHAKCLGHAGHPQVRTPHLDRLAREGVRFTRAVTNNPICTPSRVSFLTGQYPHNHGYYGLEGPRPAALPSLFGQFRAAGYRTGAIGKIHCPHGWVEADTDVCLEAYANLATDGRSAYDDYLRELGLLDQRDDQRFPDLGPTAPSGLMDGRPSRLPYRHSVEGWAVQEAQRFITHCAEQPWLLQVGLPWPHSNYTPAQEFWDLYDHETIWLPPNTDADLTGKAPHLRATRAWYDLPSFMAFEPKTFAAFRKRKQHGYLGCVSQVDHAVGELLAYLDARGLAERTLVIYIADHGDYASEFGILEKAPGICGDAICRIPFLWRWPGQFAAGHAAAEIVESVDLAPTVARLAGLEPLPTADGCDLTPLLRGEHRVLHELGVTEHPWSRAVLRDDWRLVYYPRGFFAPQGGPTDFGELCDLTSDPWETRNLYFDPAHRDRVRELERALLDWLVTTTRVRTMHPPQSPAADGKVPWRALRATPNLNYK